MRDTDDTVQDIGEALRRYEKFLETQKTYTTEERVHSDGSRWKSVKRRDGSIVRTMSVHPHTFTCQECSERVTVDHWGGVRAQYCPDCVSDVKRRQARERKRRQRARDKSRD